MAITLVGWGPINTSGANQNFQNSGGAVTPALPSGIQAGDLIVLFCMNNDGTNATGFSATGYGDPSGDLSFAGVNRVSLLYKLAGASESNPTVSTSGSGLTNDPSMVLVGVWRGVKTNAMPVSGSIDIAYLDLLITNPNTVDEKNTRNITTGTAFIYPSVSYSRAIPYPTDMLVLVVSGRPNDYTTAPGDAGGYSIISTETTLGSDSAIVAAYQILTNATSGSIAEGDFGGGAGAGTAGSTALVAVFQAPVIPTPAYPYSQIIVTETLGAFTS